MVEGRQTDSRQNWHSLLISPSLLAFHFPCMGLIGALSLYQINLVKVI